MTEAEHVPDPMDVVFAFVDARRRHDIDAIRDLLHPDVVHEGFTPELRCDGRDAVLENVRSNFERTDAGVDHLELRRIGKSVLLGFGGPGFADAPWAGQSATLYILHTVRDGKIVAMRDFLDRDDAMAAA